MKSIFAAFFLIFNITGLTAQMAPTPEEFSNPTISVGVVVSDLDKAIDFYTSVIGMTQTGAFSVEGDKAKELGLSDGRRLDVKILKLENSERSNEWKLMSFGKEASHPKQKYVHDDTGMQYITLFVNEIHPFINRIKKQNIPVLSGEPSVLDDGRKFVLIQDPDGTFIEIIGLK
jgi:catechol 2,3-dioxygenase-like lactoylglutathione lyase family enzyme